MNKLHAFWQPSTGPENWKGESLHWIEDTVEAARAYMADAEADADTRRVATLQRRIDQVESGEYPVYTHPSIGWWVSQKAFEAGDTGFGGITKRMVFDKNPDLTIHASKAEAVTAAGYEVSRG